MKPFSLLYSFILLSMISVICSAQSGTTLTDKQKTETFKVWGNCNMCKDRIEAAAIDAGATSALWDTKTKMLKVSFDPSKTNIEAISKKIASVGHDTERFRAEDKVYNALPGCCKYDRAPVTAKIVYTCPMHPDVHSDKPGKCPECGMALVKK